MNNKGGRPKKEASELRLKNVMVAFSISEWDSLHKIMDKVGYQSPSIFLRVSGLRSKLPPKVFVPEIHKRIQERIVEGVRSIKKMSDLGIMNDYDAGEFLVSLRSIAFDLTNAADYKKIELMDLEIKRLNEIITRSNGGDA